MEQKNNLDSKGSKKKYLIIAAAIVLLVVALFWALSGQRNNQTIVNETGTVENSEVASMGEVAVPESMPVEGSLEGGNMEGVEENLAPVVDSETQMTEGNVPEEEPIEKTDPITVNMEVKNDGFSPQTIDVKAGQEVTLNISSPSSVSIVVFDGGFASAVGISAGQSKEVKFTAPRTRGEYSFHNDVPTLGFTGKIIVK